jgi:uncharacterized protein YndB with AHSA1/START domain
MKPNSEPIIVAQNFNAGVDEVWAVITDGLQMKQWFFETMNSFKPEVGFKTRFNVQAQDKNYIHLWDILEVHAKKKIVCDWRYEGYPGESKVIWELKQEGDHTKLTLTHSGHETFPQDNPDFKRESCIAGWNYFINQRLYTYLETAHEILIPAPGCEITTERIMNAGRELVFKAWADPLHLKNWWGPKGFTNTFHIHDLRPGGKWSFVMHGPQGNNYPNECVFIKIKEPVLIAWNHLSNPQFKVLTTFEAMPGNRTKVVFKMIFSTATECSKIKSFAPGKNEENFDKLETELKKMSI